MCKSQHLLQYLSTVSGICTQFILCFSTACISYHGLLLPFKSLGTRTLKACVCRTKSGLFCCTFSAALSVSGVENHVKPPHGSTTDDSSMQLHQLHVALLFYCLLQLNPQRSTTFMFLQELNVLFVTLTTTRWFLISCISH